MTFGLEGKTLKRVTDISELLNDSESLVQIAQTVACGGSIETVEMQQGFPPGMLKAWIQNGKEDASAMRESMFSAFYRFYLAAASEARLAAEASLLAKNPAAWLTRCDPLKELQEHQEETDTLEHKPASQAANVSYKEFPDPE